MKRLTAIFFLLIITASSTEAHELLKLPFLVFHFVEHQKKDSGLGFGDFLKLHYNQPSNNDNDEEDDMKLPFKASADVNFTVYLFSAKTIETRPAHFESRQDFSLFQNKLIPSQIAFSVFHPPRA